MWGGGGCSFLLLSVLRSKASQWQDKVKFTASLALGSDLLIFRGGGAGWMEDFVKQISMSEFVQKKKKNNLRQGKNNFIVRIVLCTNKKTGSCHK